MSGIGNVLKTQYDKLIAALVTVVLLGALVVVAVGIGRFGGIRKTFWRELAGKKPAHPQAALVDVGVYESAKQRLVEPPQIGEWTNALTVPETRVWCLECRYPISIRANTCPFCGVAVADENFVAKDRDTDLDGMYDGWEKEHNLDPRNPDDAARDSDGDGFSNLEEFKTDPSTDPFDPTKYPPLPQKLQVIDIEAVPFKLLFKSKITLPDGSFKFAINTRDERRTYFVKLKDEVEGFKVVKFESKIAKEIRGGVPVSIDTSILTLQRGKKLIPLTMGKRRSYEEQTGILLFSMDGSEHKVNEAGTLELKSEKYQVLKVDSRHQAVVIRRLPDGKQFVIRKASVRDSSGIGEVRSPHQANAGAIEGDVSQ